MALLNPSPALPLPTTMWITWRTIVEFGPLSRDGALSWTSPSALRVDRTKAGGALPGEDLRPTPGAEAAFEALCALDLIGSDRDRWAAATSTRPGDYAGFCRLLRGAVLRPEANDVITNLADIGGPKDLVRALAWLLTKDPVREKWSWTEVQQDPPAGVGSEDRPVFVNDTRWNGFRYWAEALGFAEVAVLGTRGAGERLVSNPTRALRDTVTARWKPGERVPAGVFLPEIRRRLPVLPGGEVSLALGYAVDGRVIDRATSYAMQGGELRGWIVAEARADAENVLMADLDHPGSLRAITDILVRDVDDV